MAFAAELSHDPHGAPRGEARAPAASPAPGASGRPLLLGLVGTGIAASRTPAMHEREGEAQGLRPIYKLLDTDALGLGAEALPEIVVAARRLGFDGLNVTHPFKQAVLPLLDELSGDARALGAVNTVVFSGPAGARRAAGHNTDGSGFAESVRRGLAGAKLEIVAQFGAGGAGAAVAHALLGLGVGALAIVDVDAARAQALADALNARFGRGRAEASTPDNAAFVVAAADGIVNATPLGMARYPGTALDVSLLEPRHWVADIVYLPLETALLAAARARGCRVLPGGGMAVFQAVHAFKLFTGLEPDAERMLRHFASLS